jgi:hypothetical protein
MPPPYKPSLSDSRRRLFDEGPETRFFPSTPQQPANGFSSWTGPRKSLNDMETVEEILARRNQREALLARNASEMRDLEARDRLRPYANAADIETAKLREVEAREDAADSPFIHEDNRSIRQAHSVKRAAELEDLPSVRADEKITRKARAEAWETADSTEAKLQGLTKNPAVHQAYRSFLDRGDPKMPKAARRQAAFKEALRLEQDAPGIQAIDEAIADGEQINRDDLLEAVDDGENFYGFRLKNDPKVRAQVAALAAKRNTQKARDAQRRLDTADQREESARLRILLSNVEQRLKADPENPELLAEQGEYIAGLKEASPQRARQTGAPAPQKPAAAPAPKGKSYLQDAMKAAQGG